MGIARGQVAAAAVSSLCLREKESCTTSSSVYCKPKWPEMFKSIAAAEAEVYCKHRHLSASRRKEGRRQCPPPPATLVSTAGTATRNFHRFIRSSHLGTALMEVYTTVPGYQREVEV